MAYNDERENNMFYNPQSFDFTNSTSQSQNHQPNYGNGYQSENTAPPYNAYQTNPYRQQSQNQQTQNWNTTINSEEELSQYPPYHPQNDNFYGSYPSANPTYQEYNRNDTQQSYDPTSANGSYERAVEVPIKRKKRIADFVLIIGFFILFFGCFAAVLFTENAVWFTYVYIAVFMGYMAFVFVWGFIVLPILKKRHINQVCTVPLKGRYIGYDKQRYHNKYRTYYTYAPKYKIFVNNRYEIRTLDEYTNDRPTDEGEVDLLVNPSGYEIKRVSGTTPREAAPVFAYMIVLIFLVFILLLPLIFSLSH